MSKKAPWVRAESSSHPGRFYYYNKVTKASTWALPEGWKDADIPSLRPKGQQEKNVRQPRLRGVTYAPFFGGS